jgi:hypothetical protein
LKFLAEALVIGRQDSFETAFAGGARDEIGKRGLIVHQ